MVDHFPPFFLLIDINCFLRMRLYAYKSLETCLWEIVLSKNGQGNSPGSTCPSRILLLPIWFLWNLGRTFTALTLRTLWKWHCVASRMTIQLLWGLGSLGIQSPCCEESQPNPQFSGLEYIHRIVQISPLLIQEHFYHPKRKSCPIQSSPFPML